MSGPHFCPHCGYDLAADTPIERGDISSDPRGELRWKGEALNLTPAQRILVHSVLKAGGRTVPSELIAERIGSETDNPKRMISVLRSQIRQRLGFSLPIKTVYGVGLRWAT